MGGSSPRLISLLERLPLSVCAAPIWQCSRRNHSGDSMFVPD